MRRFFGPGLLGGLTLAFILMLVGGTAPEAATTGAPVVITPSPDRLAIPVMPDSPTQVDTGRNVYYYHCMPCHGDRGQGLTDEWRQVWVEDHQNCWARGCHAGREGDEGFSLPHTVPAVSGSSQAMAGFSTADDLFSFLAHTHPPQRPGALAEDEYWALAAFLLHENGRLPSDGQVGSKIGQRAKVGAVVAAVVAFGVLILALYVFRRRRRAPVFVDPGVTRDPHPEDFGGKHK